MSETVLLAIIGGIQIVMVTWLKTSMNRIKRDTTVTKEQVTNNHKTNLREESDERHEELVGLIATVDHKVTGAIKRIDKIDAFHKRSALQKLFLKG